VSHQPTLSGFDDSLEAEIPPPELSEPAASGACQPPPEPPDLTGKTVYLVDSHSLIYQVFHALPEMSGPNGQPVGAIQGFIGDLLHLIDVRGAEDLIVAV